MNKALNMLKITFEVVLVIAFIFFEELVWKKLALPVKNWLVSLEILQGVQAKIMLQSTYMILLIFLVPLAIAEVMGIYSGMLIVSGSLIMGVLLYIIKIPVAGLTFWIFSFSKDRLLTIDWFETLYDLMVRLFDWIKSTNIYRRVRYSIYRVKKYFKNLKGNGFREDIDHVYKGLVQIFKGRNTHSE